MTSSNGLIVKIATLLAVVLVVPLQARERLYPARSHEQGQLNYIGSVPVATFTGSPAEIGEQHAVLIGKPGAPLLKFSRMMLADSGLEHAWPMAVNVSKQLLSRTPQRYRSELRSAIQHAEVDADEVFVANSLLELRRLGCSTLIVEPKRSTTGGPIFGRNFDFPSLGMLDKYSLLTITHTEGKHSFASVGFPGLIGVISGMNDAGLAIATLDVEASGNDSPQFDPDGEPMMLVFRQILEECSTVADAEALLRRTKATTWANLAVCDREGGAVFELTPTEIARRDASKSILPCTNHFRSLALAAGTECTRYESLSSALDQPSLDVDAVHQHLVQVSQGELTLQTMIFLPRELVLHLAIGSAPSTELPLQRIELKKLLSKE